MLKPFACLILILSFTAAAEAVRCEAVFPLPALTLAEGQKKYGVYSSAELEVYAGPLAAEGWMYNFRERIRWGNRPQYALGILTTETGKVGIIFERMKSETGAVIDFLPEELSALKVTNEAELFALDFDKLDAGGRSKVIEIAASILERSGVTYDIHRAIPGLKIRDWARLYFNEPVTIDGKKYSRGTHLVPLGRWFMPKVEFGNYKRKAHFLELHFQVRDLPPSEATRIAEVMKAAIDPEGKPAHHLNVGAPVNWERLAHEGELGAFRFTEALVRADWMDQMINVVHDNGVLRDKKQGAHTFWGIRKIKEVRKIYDYFVNRSRGIPELLKDDAKMSYIAPRDSNDPSQILVEYRNSGSHVDSPEGQNRARALMDDFTHAMIREADLGERQARRLGIKDENLREWIKDRGHEVENLRPLVDRLWFNDDQFLEHAPPELADRIAIMKKLGLLNWMKDPQHLEFRMLFYDYRQQPVFQGREVQQDGQTISMYDFILTKQKLALDRILRGSDPGDVVPWFLQASRVFAVVGESFKE